MTRLLLPSADTAKKLKGYVQPMLATPGGKPFDDAEWLFEIKWDGYRAIAETSPVRLYSRTGLNFLHAYPDVVDELARMRKKVVLDGELVALNEQGLPDFQRMSLAAGDPHTHVTYMVFDILALNGMDLCALPLLKRKAILRDVLTDGRHVRFCEHVIGKGRTFFNEVRKRGMEGLIAKRADSIYRKGVRNKEWLKVKNLRNQEVVIGGYTAPQNSRSSFGSLLLGVYEKGKLVYCGHTGTGFSNAALRALYLVMKPLERPTSPFTTIPKANERPTWVEPRLVCNVEFTEWTRDGKLRHPSYKGLRPDKPLLSVKREKK